MTYSRDVDGLVRKPDERRKAARKRKAERVEQAAQQQQAELKRLKNLKKAELMSQLATIRQVAGHHEPAAFSKIMQGDFEPEAYDAAMAAAFDDDYYEVREPGLVRSCCLALCMRVALLHIVHFPHHSMVRRSMMTRTWWLGTWQKKICCLHQTQVNY